ncbi:MAG: hypothetical protein WC856_25210 [Methylococcaceae bacterium]|jgi:dienelactone hydrolase
MRQLIELLIWFLRWISRWLEHFGTKTFPLTNDDNTEVPIEKLDLRDRPGFLSPPIVVGPLYQCAPDVGIRGFITHAEIDVRIDGLIVLTQEGLNPDGQQFSLPVQLRANQTVDARQRFDGAESDWSYVETAKDHTIEFPAGLPRPEINPPPLYKCGASTAVSNLLNGCKVWLTADGTRVGGQDGAGTWQSVHVNPDFGLGQDVIAFASLCEDASPPSQTEVTQTAPQPLLTPSFGDAYDGGERIAVSNLAHGARFTVWRNGALVGTYRSSTSSAAIRLTPAMVAGDILEAEQSLCVGDPASSKGTTTVKSCSDLPAPKVEPIQAGDILVHIVDMAAGARIKVFVNGVESGDGGGHVIQLENPIPHGATVYIQQILGSCVGQTVMQVNTRCVHPRVTDNPAHFNLFPIGYDDFDAGTTSIDGLQFNVRGNVYYPADADGKGTPFNTRLAGVGRTPIICLVHGRHGAFRDPVNPINLVTGEENSKCSNPGGWVEIPNHEGYIYFQEQLARMGFVVVSINMNQTCSQPMGGAANIRHRAHILNESIRHFQSLDSSAHAIFGNKIDFDRIGLMGHSRGGEAVLLATSQNPPANVQFRAVLSLAPVDFGLTNGTPNGFAFMTILPAGDGDVVDNDGAKFYDRATPKPFKAQLYIDGAGHNPFNRQWLVNEGNGVFHLSRTDHERILSAYGCAFFRQVLMDHATVKFLTGKELPTLVLHDRVHLSFEWPDQLNVDHHEDNNGIAKNSLDEPTSQSGGLSANEYKFAQSGGAFNASFYGNTTGMVAESREKGGVFRSQLDGAKNLRDKEVWIRAADIYNGSSVSSSSTGFEIGLEDDASPPVVAWVDTDVVGGLPRPFDRRADDINDPWLGTDKTKTMLKTLRFPAHCFAAQEPTLKLESIRAILIRCRGEEKRPLAFDILQVVSK